MMTHYETLGLDPGVKHALTDIKVAYRQTLLTYHPDKIQLADANDADVPSSTTSVRTTETAPTVDAIVTAFHILSDERKRSEYDRDLRVRKRGVLQQRKADDHAGLDNFDLEDLVYEEDSATGQSVWSKECRCGRHKGFLVTEADLEIATKQNHDVRDHSILVECAGCSLLIRVTFAVEPG
jgi:diphthamide biosynthesis protein 4